MMSYFSKHIQTLTKAYRLYLRGLNRDEIERLLKHDTTEVYAYYTRDIQAISRADFKKPRLFFPFLKDIFISFLLKLSPARRAFYMVGLLVFGWGILTAQAMYEIAGFIILNLLLALELADKLKAKNELEFAREIQLSLLPQIPPKIDNLLCTAFSETAREVGGDYYDWFRLDDGRVLFVIGDVSGKGITAALYMVRFQGFIQMLVRDNPGPKELLSQLNQLCVAQLKANYFVTAAIALYSPGTGEMTICRAGHNPVFHYQATTGQTTILEPDGMALGLENNGIFEATLRETKIKIEAGDFVFLYTDGLNETENINLQQFGEQRIIDTIAQAANRSPETLKSNMVAEVLKFRGKQSIHDDLTFFIIKAA